MTSSAMKVARRSKKKRKGYADGGAPIWGDVGGAMPEAYQDPNRGLGASLLNMVNNVATLPQRAVDAAKISAAHAYGPRPDTMSDSDAPFVDPLPGVAAEAAMNVIGGAGVVPAEANALRMGIKAYHGSPHDFDAFDLSKIGTGEGAQAYGHGLYFAENEKVAKGYRDQLTNGRYVTSDGQFDPSSLGHVNVRVAARRGIDDGISRAEELLKSPGQEQNQAMLQGDLAALRDAKAKQAAPNPGKMYEVDINADPEHFLDWDRPLSEQHPQTQDAVKQAMGPNWDQFKFAKAGDAVKQGFIAPGVESTASKLHEAGIPGIKYLDQGSRAAGDGSRNYVVFDDKLISILRKYGIAGLPAGAAAALSGKGKDDTKMKSGGSVSAAMSVARHVKRAKGGGVHVGPIIGDTGGRADKRPMHVPDGAYVLTADHCNSLGEGNTLAGFRKLAKMFPLSAKAHEEGAKAGPAKRASGGKVPIYAADGEWVIGPDDIKKRWGDLDTGHKVLDAWQTAQRKEHIKTLANLDPPAQD